MENKGDCSLHCHRQHGIDAISRAVRLSSLDKCLVQIFHLTPFLETKSELTEQSNKFEEIIYSDFRSGSFFLLTARGLISVGRFFSCYLDFDLCFDGRGAGIP